MRYVFQPEASHQVTSQQTVPTIRQKIDTPSRTWLPFSPLRQYTPEPHQAAARAALFDHEARLFDHEEMILAAVHAPC